MTSSQMRSELAKTNQKRDLEVVAGSSMEMPTEEYVSSEKGKCHDEEGKKLKIRLPAP